MLAKASSKASGRERDRGRVRKKIKNRESGVIEVEGGELEGGLGAKEGEKFEKKQRGEATQAQREKRRFVFARV